ncbi:hypothetical protein GYMLUDRAFT_199996 [Collybiopsis luxurians FD-317 M1]|uniref:Unplaced genomic scaffold GYMLUscaffold_24, whole genome shotgun sequence n=1 Tax=Collybiopsis luxurians FD-317 M1 TaxID=944289 RepID=A0A0D0BBV0_9AGAR|nr:hypothetical protein GYMLUDRAFT_199996 [Collybiopsis luxurians FD-317 M1]
MSFLLGPVSGALVAGGIYYGFSNLMQSRQALSFNLRCSLHTQSYLLLNSPTPAWISTYPPPAASRIEHKPFISVMQASWNEHLEKAFVWARDADKHVVKSFEEFGEWAGRKIGKKE